MNRKQKRQQKALLKKLAHAEIDRMVEAFEDFQHGTRVKVEDERAKKLLRKALRSMVAIAEPEIVIRISDEDARALPAAAQTTKPKSAKFYLAVGFDAGMRATYALRWIDTARLAAEAPALTPQDVMLEHLRDSTGHARISI